MDDLHFNLAQEEFSRGRKAILWFMAIAATIITAVVVYLFMVKHLTTVTLGLIIALAITTSFFYLIALLATVKRKEHFFKVDKVEISYHYGLMFQTHHTYKWPEIKAIFFPPHSKKTTLVLKSDKAVHINLTWVEKNKARSIRKHIFYTAKEKGLEIHKTNYKK